MRNRLRLLKEPTPTDRSITVDTTDEAALEPRIVEAGAPAPAGWQREPLPTGQQPLDSWTVALTVAVGDEADPPSALQHEVIFDPARWDVTVWHHPPTDEIRAAMQDGGYQPRQVPHGQLWMRDRSLAVQTQLARMAERTAVAIEPPVVA